MTAPLRMGVREYARYRKERGLPGTSHTAVQKAITKGWFHRGDDGLINVSEADQAWDRVNPAGAARKQAAPLTPSEPKSAPPGRRERAREGSPAAVATPKVRPEVATAPEAPRGGPKRPPRNYRDDLEDEDSEDDGGPLIAAQTRKEWAIARRRELELEELRGTLIALSDLKEVMAGVLTVLNNSLDNLASALPPRLQACEDMAAMRDLIEREVQATKAELIAAAEDPRLDIEPEESEPEVTPDAA